MVVPSVGDGNVKFEGKVSLHGLIIIIWGGRGGGGGVGVVKFLNFNSFGCCISYKNVGNIGTEI